MSRNRMIKPEFWSSATLMKISLQARLTFIGIWNFCDDYGFYLHSIRKLIGDIYPNDEEVSEKNVSKWLNELIEVKVIIPIEHDNKKLLFVKSWGEHQKVQHKSKRAFIKDTEIEGVIMKTLESHETLIKNYIESHVPKKKEESNKEKEESNKEKEESNKEKEALFVKAWDLYEKKGTRSKSLNYWNKLSEETMIEIIDKIPLYINSTPEKQYRKNFEGWINPANEMWRNEIVENTVVAKNAYQQDSPKIATRNTPEEIAYLEKHILDAIENEKRTGVPVI